MDNQAALLNMDTINELINILGDNVYELYTDFYHTTPTLLELLEQAHEMGNEQDIITHSHTIKGSAGNIGLEQLFEQSKYIELSLRNNIDIDIDSLLNKLNSTYELTIAELRSQGLLRQ